MSVKAEDLIFVDFEASGLGRFSWPIEIGLAWIEAGTVRIWSSLIRPAPGWSMDDWVPESEAIHGIPRADLEAAPSALMVAVEASGLMKGKTVCSDAPEFDGKWAARLLDEMPDPFFIDPVYIHNALIEVLSEARLDRFYEKLGRIPAPHRAGPDAGRYARALEHALFTPENNVPGCGA